ncbi:tRNA-His guanylyltransferase [Ceratobasidium sp. 423]|nr:tRNA-His guanylyltransferase [Ceratobasidium sp. 423]
MANTRFQYVRSFELPDPLLPNTHLVLRIDGHAFHKFSDAHGFRKPNDERALQLMDKAAQTVMEEYPDIEIRDYFSWRQADTHINNLYNTTFWALVQQGGMTAREAETRLKGTLSKDKHEILFSSYNINYNSLPERFKKGSVLVREMIHSEPDQVASPNIQKGDTDITDVNDPVINLQDVQDANPTKPESKRVAKKEKRVLPTAVRVIHVDIIKDDFWTARPELLDS